jgi:PKD repeat protein
MPRGHIYFVGNRLQTIRSATDTSIWLAHVHVHNTVKLENAIRILGTLDLHDSLDLSGHDIYHYIYDDFSYTGNWGKWHNETDSTFVYDSDANKRGDILMLKTKNQNLDDLASMGLTIAANDNNAKVMIIRKHAQDAGVTSGTIRKHFDVVKSEFLNPNNPLKIAYFKHDYNPAETTEADFSLFEIRADGSAPKGRRLQSSLDVTAGIVTSTDSITWREGMRYSVAAIRCSDAPHIDLGADTVLCAGLSLTLKAPVTQHLPVRFEWRQDDLLLKKGDNDSILQVQHSGKYFVRAIDNRGCETVDSISVRIAPSPQPVIHATFTRRCESDPFTFWYTDTSSVTITEVQWGFGDNTFATDSSYTKSYAPLCGTYPVILTATSTDGCVASDTLPVAVEQRRQPQIRMESLYDTIGTFVLIDTLQNCPEDMTGVTWYVNHVLAGTGNRLDTCHFPGYGDYQVSVQMDGSLCTAYTQDTVHVRAPGVPRFTLPKRDYCAGEPVAAVNTSEVNIGMYDYYWNYGNGKTSQDSIPAVTYTAAGSYIITLTMISSSIPGWQQACSDTVYVHGNPQINFGGTVSYCKAQYTLQPEEGPQPYYIYEWELEGVSVGSGEALTAVADGNYSLIMTDTRYGCRSAENVQLLLNDHLRPHLGGDRENCGSLVLGAVPVTNAAYLWNTGAVTREITVTESGTYQVYIRDEEGCEGRDTVAITIHDVPNVTLGDDIFLCDNETITLQPPANTAGALYVWNTGATAEALSVAGHGMYSVRVTHANGICAASDTIQVLSQQAPVITFAEEPYICNNQRITLSQHSHYYAEEIRWTYPDGQTATGTEISTAQIGLHRVYIRYANGCSASGSVTALRGETNAVANFMVSSKNILNDVLQFVNLSYPDPLTYQWEVEDRVFSTEENPQLTLYAEATWMVKDTFEVRLTVSDGACPVSRVKQLIILPETASIRMLDVETGEEVIIRPDDVIPNTNYIDILDATVYPNPTSTGQFTITAALTSPEKLQVVVFSLLGHIMDRKVCNASDYHQVHFSTHNYSFGIYLVHLSAGKKTRLLKVIVTK